MSIHRLLVLKSINDEYTLEELKYLTNSPVLQGIDVRFCYAVQMDELDLEKPDPYTVSYDKLLDMLEMEVLAFQPDALILHTGIAFRMRPDSFLQALAVIKDRYPNIKLGYEPIPIDLAETYPKWRSIPDPILARFLDGNSLFDDNVKEILA